MKWRHKKLIDESFYLKRATKEYSDITSPTSLYYLLGLAALKFINENRTGVVYYKYFGSIFVRYRVYYYGFKVIGASDINIGVRLLTTGGVPLDVIYSSSYKFSHYEVKT